MIKLSLFGWGVVGVCVGGCGEGGGGGVRTTNNKEAACYDVTKLQINSQLMTARAEVRQSGSL